jgi:hypothetical protein
MPRKADTLEEIDLYAHHIQGGIWKPASVEEQPEAFLISGGLFRVPAWDKHPEAIHMVGYSMNYGEGRVSSPLRDFRIVNDDRPHVRATSRSGRLYALALPLYGRGGINLDAAYVLGSAHRAWGLPEEIEFEFLTMEDLIQVIERENTK